MRIERVAINAAPLITLFRAGLHPLLPQLFPDLVVPEAVWDELISRTYGTGMRIMEGRSYDRVG